MPCSLDTLAEHDKAVRRSGSPYPPRTSALDDPAAAGTETCRAQPARPRCARGIVVLACLALTLAAGAGCEDEPSAPDAGPGSRRPPPPACSPCVRRR